MRSVASTAADTGDGSIGARRSRARAAVSTSIAITRCAPSIARRSLRAALQKGYPAELAKNDPQLKNLAPNPDLDKLVAVFQGKTN